MDGSLDLVQFIRVGGIVPALIVLLMTWVLGSALGRLNVVVEAYPDLKANAPLRPAAACIMLCMEAGSPGLEAAFCCAVTA